MTTTANTILTAEQIRASILSAAADRAELLRAIDVAFEAEAISQLEARKLEALVDQE